MARDFQQPFVLPAGAGEVVLVRHGSTGSPGTDGPHDLLDGQGDPPLTPSGHVQAAAVGARLASRDVGGLFVTPLRRTSQTAGPLAAHLDREPVVVPELREVMLGDWEGEFKERMARDDALSRRIFATERWDVIPNAEPMEAFSARVRVGLERVATAAGPGGTAVAVTHGGVIAEACRQVTGSQAFAFLAAENASITRLVRMASGRWALISFNDTAHLEVDAD